jgi:uncharacterized protein (DUF1778 family)
MARPPLPESERRSHVLQTRVTTQERELVEKGAEAAGSTPAEFLREAALEQASKALKRPRKQS